MIPGGAACFGVSFFQRGIVGFQLQRMRVGVPCLLRLVQHHVRAPELGPAFDVVRLLFEPRREVADHRQDYRAALFGRGAGTRLRRGGDRGLRRHARGCLQVAGLTPSLAATSAMRRCTKDSHSASAGESTARL
jgi:hypothetical protein